MIDHDAEYWLYVATMRLLAEHFPQGIQDTCPSCSDDDAASIGISSYHRALEFCHEHACKCTCHNA
jgi:hypothetical protein